MDMVKTDGCEPCENEETVGQTAAQSFKGEKTKSTAVPVTGCSLKMQKRLRFQPENVNFVKQGHCHEYSNDLLDAKSLDKVEIPRAISVADRVESGAKEMKAMLRAVSQHTGNRAALQKIPRHMRRRAASHNRKRLPRRLHRLAAEMAANSQNDGGNKSTKPPNRKKRRKKRDLQNEFQKRAGKQGWLETHLWHAKRFHMTDSGDPKYANWGNRVALHPNDKSFRACHRAVANHCLIQDISYLRCLLLCGSKTDLLLLFKDICGVEFDQLVIDGQKEVEVVVTKPPDGNQESRDTAHCVGPVSVLWQPEFQDKSRILVWLHPVILTLLLDVIRTCSDAKGLDIAMREVSDDILRFRLTGAKSSITLLSVLRPLNLHSLSTDGDETKKVLYEWVENRKDVVGQLHRDFIAVATACHRQIFARAREAVDTSGEPGYSDGSVFPVITDDPRLTLPLDKTTPSLTKSKKKLKEHMDYNGDEFAETDPSEGQDEWRHPPLQCCSPLWSEAIRDEVAGNRKPDHVVSTRKHQRKFETDERRKEIWRKSLSMAVPVIAIRKIPNQNRNLELGQGDVEKKEQEELHSGPNEIFAAGWDLLLPKNWATAFWIPLIYHRARAGGLRENENVSLECLRPHFPEDFPDTIAARDFWSAECEKLASKYYRRPPAKRPNYSVLAVTSPFKPDWAGLSKPFFNIEGKDLKRPHESCSSGIAEKRRKLEKQSKESDGEKDENCLISEENNSQHRVSDVVAESTEHFANSSISVLRDESLLLQLKDWILSTTKTPIVSISESALPDLPRSFSAASSLLVCVAVKALGKGIPFSRSMICSPTTEDLDGLCDELTDPYKYGLKSVTGPLESKHWDPYRKERKEARKLARKRKKKSKVAIITSGEVADVPSRRESDDGPPNQPRRFPVLPSREAVGYVTSGGFLYAYARGAGVGFVASDKLVLLAQKQANHVKLGKALNEETHRRALSDGAPQPPLLALMRNTDSAQYRFVKLEMIKPQ